MAAALKSSAPRRALQQGFAATAVRTPAARAGAAGTRRKLHITGAKKQSPFLAFESAVQELPRRAQATPPRRAINTSRALKANRDTSTIDFAYMPDLGAATTAAAGDRPDMAVPLLPDKYLSAALLERAHAGAGSALTSPTAAAVVAAPVRNPEISVASLGGGAVAALSEADPGGAAADRMGVGAEARGEEGVVRQVLTGLLDDVFGAKGGSKAA